MARPNVAEMGLLPSLHLIPVAEEAGLIQAGNAAAAFDILAAQDIGVIVCDQL